MTKIKPVTEKRVDHHEKKIKKDQRKEVKATKILSKVIASKPESIK